MSKLRVLMYHKITEGNPDFLSVTLNDFKAQMGYIQNEYSPVRLSEIISMHKNGKLQGRKPILITFDDGYENNFTLAYPVLKSLNIPFVVFPIAAFTGKEAEYDGVNQKFLSIEQLKAMSDLAEYAYHGFDHLNFMKLSEDEIRIEIRKSIESYSSGDLNFQSAWAYTYGAFPKGNALRFNSLKNIFRDNGIELAFRIGNRLNYWPLKDTYKIERLDIRGDQSFLTFRRKLRFGRLF